MNEMIVAQSELSCS